MQRNHWFAVIVLAVCALLLMGSGDSGGGGESSSEFTVDVGMGTTPSYSWTVGDAFSVSVARTSDRTTIVWGLATPVWTASHHQ